MKTNISLTDDLAQEEDLLQRYRERIEKLSQSDGVSKFWIDTGFLTTVEVGQYFMTKDTEEFSQFTDSVTCREYTLSRDESLSKPNEWIRGTSRLNLYWKLQSVAYKINIEWKSELSLWTWTILTRGSEFLMTWTSWPQIWTTRSRTTTSRNSQKLCVKIECKCFCKPIKGQSKTTKTYLCQLIHKNYFYWGKNLDWYWITRIFALWLFSVKETDQSSSSW